MSHAEDVPLQGVLKAVMIECARAAGDVLMGYFGGDALEVRLKENQSSIVTAADLAAERRILGILRERFPDHGVVSEESGYVQGSSALTWVVDPLDGTSNFAAGLPWFGVLLAVLESKRPTMAVMFIPALKLLYFAEKGQGVWRNEERIRVSRETQLSSVLCAFGMDVSAEAAETRRQVEALGRVIKRVRNFRCTNSLLDLCFTVDGRLGGCVNYNTRIWDIAPLCLMLPEAGGRLTDVGGNEIELTVDPGALERNYTILGANPTLHPALLRLLRGDG